MPLICICDDEDDDGNDDDEDEDYDGSYGRKWKTNDNMNWGEGFSASIQLSSEFRVFGGKIDTWPSKAFRLYIFSVLWMWWKYKNMNTQIKSFQEIIREIVGTVKHQMRLLT